MTVLEFLNTVPVCPIFKTRPAIICNSGAVISIQQSDHHYSGKNTVEIYFTNPFDKPAHLDLGKCSHGCYGWVSTEIAQEIIDFHKGIEKLEK